MARDLRRPGLPREKVVATIVKLLETTFARVGNEEYARENGSFGLTTLRNRHVKVSGATVRFVFRGKSGVENELGVTDRRVASVIKRCEELPGQMLFQYVDESGGLRDVTGEDFTAKVANRTFWMIRLAHQDRWDYWVRRKKCQESIRELGTATWVVTDTPARIKPWRIPSTRRSGRFSPFASSRTNHYPRTSCSASSRQVA